MKIGLVGTVSVGKTTLVNALKELPQFQNYHFATERSKYLRDLGIPLNTDSGFCFVSFGCLRAGPSQLCNLPSK